MSQKFLSTFLSEYAESDQSVGYAGEFELMAQSAESGTEECKKILKLGPSVKEMASW